METRRPMVAGQPVSRRLIGVGVGPGDPELLTLKALRVLGDADVVLVPATEGSADGEGRAEQIVRSACPAVADRIRRVPFSMTDRSGVSPRRREAWQTSARAVLDAFAAGAGTVCLATVGDPSVYSTFSYLAAHVEQALLDVAVEVIPGVTAMQALASASRSPLVEGTEVLALVPVTAGMDAVARVLDVADTVVAYKVGRRYAELTDLLRDRGRAEGAVVGVDIGCAGESVSGLGGISTAPYFSTVLCPPVRTTPGGRL